tara:strand:- start:191 stop:559 length:369 start_codon:yes stop_codon:yes gene_type:complete
MSSPAEIKGEARDARLASGHSHTKREHEHVRKLLLAEARDKCAETRALYVGCAMGRTLSLAWACRDEFRDFNDCLKQYTTDEQLEKRKEEWARDPAVIAQREAQRKVLEERQRQRDAGERRL